MKIKTAAVMAAIGAAALLAACETPTPYQPLQTGGSASGGFSQQRLDDTHYRVTFSGNSLTSRQTVETYLVYRAAELTVHAGYDWFETVDKHTERDRRTYVDPDPFYGPGYGYGYFRPSWRYYGGGFGWRSWGPFWGDPFWADTPTVTTVQKFEATADIAMGRGPKPPGDQRAYDAHAVIANLGPQIQRPKAS